MEPFVHGGDSSLPVAGASRLETADYEAKRTPGPITHHYTQLVSLICFPCSQEAPLKVVFAEDH